MEDFFQRMLATFPKNSAAHGSSGASFMLCAILQYKFHNHTNLSIEDGVGIHELTLSVVGAWAPRGLPLRERILAAVEFPSAYCIQLLDPSHVLLNLGAMTSLHLRETVYT